jgi:hypothetical protein
MQSEGVFIAIVSTVVTAVVATSTVVAALVAIVTIAVGAFGSPLFGLLIPNVEGHYHLFRRPPTSSGYDRRSSRYPHNP